MADRDLQRRYPLVPWPRLLRPASGGFRVGPGVRIVFDPPLQAQATALAAHLAAATGRAANLSQGTDGAGAIRLALRPDAPASFDGDEAYTLTVTPDHVELAARAPAGIGHGIQTLRQLAAAHREVIFSVQIEDAPRFAYRGLHLDVGRHFFPVAFIKKYLDAMAAFKLNTFHWHLTEDQGWRLEIRRYPELTRVGAWRAETIVGHARRGPKGYDGTPHGGFYTQAEAREVVAYAAERGITVMPEIEMPGHALAMIAAYPELANVPGPFAVRTTWGISEHVLSPREETFAFLEGVLSEVLDIFPSELIHIGGDEAPKTEWKASPEAQAVMAREGLKDEEELQSWFIRRIERFLNARGRRLVGWDEILEGGLAPNATVMSWRGIAGGVAAAQQGHDVIMSPQEDLYFDHYQGPPESEPLAIGGLTPLADTYRYEPVPAELTADEARHVFGPQGNVWTEYMPTTEQVEYMVYPRALALAEIAWSAKDARDWEGFQARLPAALALLDTLGIGYRRG